MGDAANQTNMAQILTTIQAHLQTLGERMARIEQPQRRAAVRNVHRQQVNQEDEMHNLEDDPPYQQDNPRQHNPQDPNNNPRERDPVHKGRGRDEELVR